jgi:hypothetical protein
MDIEMRGRVYALELLTTQLISEYLRAVPDPAGQAKWAADHLRRLADDLPLDTGGIDEEARVRLCVKDHVGSVLDAALARALTTPLQLPSYDIGPQAG